MARTDNIRGFETELSENKRSLKTELCENETTLFENSPRTSGLDHINENRTAKAEFPLPAVHSATPEPGLRRVDRTGTT
jgi:hypothetical protein